MRGMVGLFTGVGLLVAPGPAHAEEAPAVQTEQVQTEQVQTEQAQTQREVLPTLLPAVELGHGIPRIDLRGFGHVQYQASWFDPDLGPDQSTNSFVNGGVDLFITSQIAEDVSFLAETVFEFEEGGENVLDVERVFLKYEYNDALNIGAGRGHTALGYWNEHYHHGTWLQTTTDRPLMYRFEDDGGILPVHFVGVTASGRWKTGLGSLSYVGTVANGRGDITDDIQLVEDLNDQKAVGLLARFEPASLPGFGAGVSTYFDKIPDNPAPSDGTPPRLRSMTEQIYGAHVFYMGRRLEVLAEFSAILHDLRGDTSHLDHYGVYALVAYRVAEKWKPYYRYDLLSIDEGDPFYQGLAEDDERHTVGVRYDFRTFLALKAEYQHSHLRSGSENYGVIQASFAF